ncbi:MAG: hypothetical protein Q9209_004429 [Squamulea sp. 1 TL-2023]
MPIILPSNLSEADQKISHVLETAIHAGDLATINQVLDHWPNQPSSGNNSGDYVPALWPFKAALSGAIDTIDTAIASNVLERGLKIELYAVMRALDSLSAGMFQVFIDHGWDINMPLGETMPPCLAYVIYTFKIAKGLIWRCSLKLIYCLSYVLHDEDLTRWFLEHGASPNAPSSRLFRTPVMFAAATAPLPIVKLLYAYGATHENVLQTAAGSNVEGRLEVLKFVLDKGADINAIQWQHHQDTYHLFERLCLGTALHNAVQLGCKDRVELLLRKGAKDMPTSTGRTTLDIAQEFGTDDILALLTDFELNEPYVQNKELE